MDATELARDCLAEDSVGSEPCLRYWSGEWHRWDGCAYRKMSADSGRGWAARSSLNATRDCGQARTDGRTGVEGR